ncbi:MAG: tetratricopeptide repeat protein [Phycisphaerae bacterium]
MPPSTFDVLRRTGLAVLLVGSTIWIGLPSMDAPWQHGDERIFIATNPDVVGANATTGGLERLLNIFTHVHDDLYQPIPILSFAIEWAIWGEQSLNVRRDDVLLHALNGILTWAVLATLLRRVRPEWSGGAIDGLAWPLALLWALHPVQTSVFAADMGRTHLLATAFALTSLLFHLAALKTGRASPAAMAIVMLFLAMLSKALPGWVLLVFALEGATLGLRRAVTSTRVWIIGALCVLFAGLTYWTSRESGMIQDVSRALFGDPLSRSAMALWIYATSLIWPANLSPWYLPDPETSWLNPRVWAGALLALASIAHALACWRRAETRFATVGWAWFWATLLPVIGLVGARQAAAVDRYLYQPLNGLALVAMTMLAWTLARLGTARRTPVIGVLATCAAGIAAVFLWLDGPYVRMFRSSLRRAERIVELNPGDPRALEALSAACDFARGHPVPVDERPPSADTADSGDPMLNQFRFYNQGMIDVLTQAADAPGAERFFRGKSDQAAFRRRLSYRLLMCDQPEAALAQAQRAQEIEPDAPRSWERLAHAYWRLGRLEDALAAFERHAEQLEHQSPKSDKSNAGAWAAHNTNVGELLLTMNRAGEALDKLRAALNTGVAQPRATLLLARCEIRGGQGAEGFRLLDEYLRVNPDDPDALLGMGEYHLRSHHWDDALATYARLLRQAPTNYEALRGYFEVCVQTRRWREGAAAWEVALRIAPGERAYQSFLVWAAACADDARATTLADALLADDPNNPLACYGKMLIATRAARYDDAVEWARNAATGKPVPQARSTERAAALLSLLLERGELSRESLVIQAAVWMSSDRTRARNALSAYLGESPGVARELAERLDRDLKSDK